MHIIDMYIYIHIYNTFNQYIKPIKWGSFHAAQMMFACAVVIMVVGLLQNDSRNWVKRLKCWKEISKDYSHPKIVIRK